jgi:hypothetical protein
MAQFYHDFALDTTIGAVPAGFTARADSPTSWGLHREMQTMLRNAPATGSKLLSMDAVDTAADRANADIRISVSFEALNQTNRPGIMLRGHQEGGGYLAGYTVLVIPTFGVYLSKRVNGANTWLQSTTITLHAGLRYILRFQAIGTTLQGRWWAEGTPEPGTWLLSATDADISAAGWVGPATLGEGHARYHAIAVGTGTDLAVVPAPEAPSGGGPPPVGSLLSPGIN